MEVYKKKVDRFRHRRLQSKQTPRLRDGSRLIPEIREDNPSRRNTTILLVDDDEPCLQTFSEMLSDLGYTVRSVETGQAAVDTFSKEPQSFSLVILDQIMPGLTGINTAHTLLEIRGDTPIALITGWFLTDETKEYARTVGIREILEKPVGIRQLDRAIRKMLRISENKS
jgi:DNA-binding response OmpR family regulator